MNRRDVLMAAGGALALSQSAWTRNLPAKSQVLIPLHANENAYGPSDVARQAFIKAMDRASRYPMLELAGLTKAIAEREGVDEQQVVLSSGSGEVLCAAALAWRQFGSSVVAATPTFEQLPRYAERAGVRVKRVPLDTQLRHDLTAMSDEVDSSTSLIYVCNPNNPTGTMVDPDALTNFIEQNHERAVVFVDEAYLELQADPAKHSAIKQVREGKNVVIAKTFSKLHGLAGLRVGYGIAPKPLADALRNAKMSLPSGPGMAAALASYQDIRGTETRREKLVATRAWFTQSCEDAGWSCADSTGNFAFVNVGMATSTFAAKMKGQGVRVARPFPPFGEWSRITVGTRSQMETALLAMSGILGTT